MFGLSLLILLQARLPELARHQYKTARILLPSPNSLLFWDYIAPHSLRLSARITLHRCSQVLLQHRLQFLHADGFHEKSRGTVESGSLLIRRTAQRGENDDGDVAGCGTRMQFAEHFESRLSRHHDIQKDQPHRLT